MKTFWDWVGGPVVGSHTNDAILQSAGAKSKYGEVEAHTTNVKSKADCKFLGKNCDRKTKYYQMRRLKMSEFSNWLERKYPEYLLEQDGGKLIGGNQAFQARPKFFSRRPPTSTKRFMSGNVNPQTNQPSTSDENFSIASDLDKELNDIISRGGTIRHIWRGQKDYKRRNEMLKKYIQAKGGIYRLDYFELEELIDGIEKNQIDKSIFPPKTAARLLTMGKWEGDALEKLSQYAKSHQSIIDNTPTVIQPQIKLDANILKQLYNNLRLAKKGNRIFTYNIDENDWHILQAYARTKGYYLNLDDAEGNTSGERRHDGYSRPTTKEEFDKLLLYLYDMLEEDMNKFSTVIFVPAVK